IMTPSPGQPSHPPKHEHGRALFPILPSEETSSLDPVCGMTVNPATAQASTEYQGRTYYFCCPSCLQKFQANPDRYLAGAAPDGHGHPSVPSGPPAAGTSVEYTCPMHPEVISDHPGSCPICGMALEPRTVQAEEGPNPELVDMSRRFWIGLIPTALLVVLDMGRMLLFPGHHGENASLFHWLQLVLATPVVLWCGWPFFQRAWA